MKLRQGRDAKADRTSLFAACKNVERGTEDDCSDGAVVSGSLLNAGWLID